MPLLYGEGQRAFVRLQEEIMKGSDDHSIFTWTASSDSTAVVGLLAPSPANFINCDDIVPGKDSNVSIPYSMTNKGLRIQLPLRKREWTSAYSAILNCVKKGSIHHLAVDLCELHTEGDQFARIAMEAPYEFPLGETLMAVPRDIFVRIDARFPSHYDRSLSLDPQYDGPLVVLRKCPPELQLRGMSHNGRPVPGEPAQYAPRYGHTGWRFVHTYKDSIDPALIIYPGGDILWCRWTTMASDKDIDTIVHQYEYTGEFCQEAEFHFQASHGSSAMEMDHVLFAKLVPATLYSRRFVAVDVSNDERAK